jgi:hypothetical protein
VREADHHAFAGELMTAASDALVQGADPARGLRQHHRVPPARALARPGLDLQRRHPGHRGGDAIATSVAELLLDEGLARAARPQDLAGAVRASMWKPGYESCLE